MAETSFGFNSAGTAPGDRAYSASDYMAWLDTHFGGNSGVVAGFGNNLNVTSLGSYNIQVDSGGAVYIGYTYKNDSALTKTLTTLAATYKRYDRIVVRFDPSISRSAVAYVITGTASTGTPSVPALGSTDIALATIYVDNSSGTPIFTVTDNRAYRSIPVADFNITTAKLANGAVTDAKAGALTVAAMASGYKFSNFSGGTVSGTVTLPSIAVGETKAAHYTSSGGPQFYTPATGTYNVLCVSGGTSISNVATAYYGYGIGSATFVGGGAISTIFIYTRTA